MPPGISDLKLEEKYRACAPGRSSGEGQSYEDSNVKDRMWKKLAAARISSGGYLSIEQPPLITGSACRREVGGKAGSRGDVTW